MHLRNHSAYLLFLPITALEMLIDANKPSFQKRRLGAFAWCLSKTAGNLSNYLSTLNHTCLQIYFARSRMRNLSWLIFVESKAQKQAHSELCNCFNNAAIGKSEREKSVAVTARSI